MKRCIDNVTYISLWTSSKVNDDGTVFYVIYFISDSDLKFYV